MRIGPQADLGPDGDAALLFMHIPKTAGTSLRSALAAAYPPAQRALLYDPAHSRGAVLAKEFRHTPPEQHAGLRLVAGHFRWGIHRAMPGPFAYVTILRDPVDRVASLYYHHRHYKGLRYRFLPAARKARDRAAQERDLIERANMPLETWVFERRMRDVDNVMVRFISNRQGVGFGEVDEDMYAEALAHVDEHFAALLSQGDMDRSLAVLGALAGRRLRLTRRLKVNRRREKLEDIDRRVRDRLAELNRFDAQLYEVAVKRLPEVHARLVS
jgi:hypothetical protein